MAIDRNPTRTNDRNQTRVNEQIRISPIRVIGEAGEQLGIVSTADAMQRARDNGLDLVEVAPNERPPVCRIMDYGKYKYEKSRKQKHVHQTKLKEVRLRPKTGEHDVQVCVRKARFFLEHKDKVQVTVIFRGREMAHIDEGRKVMENLIAELADVAKVESPPQQNARRMNCTLAPR